MLQELKQLSSPCIGLPRLLYGSKEDRKGAWEVGVHGSQLRELGFSPTDFMTLRWRWHGGNNNKLNRAGKALVDLSQVPTDLLLLENVNVHRPIQQLCSNDAMWIRITESPLVLHHYTGTYEQWILRDDVRDKRTATLYSEINALNHMEDGNKHRWLLDFIQTMGEKNAAVLLKDVGKVDSDQEKGRLSPEAKFAKLLSLLYEKKTRKLRNP